MTNSPHVSSSEVQKSFGAISDMALREPVTIPKQGREHLVVLAADEYKRLKRSDRKVYATPDLPEEWIEAIEKAEMDPRHNHLNSLLE